MPVSKDTTTDRRVSEGLPLFPPTLIGKKLAWDYTTAYRVDSTYLDHLEQYLETRNPDLFVEAINLCPCLLKGNGRNLNVEEYLIEKGDKTIKPTTYVEASTVVGETIRWWQQLYQFVDDEEAKVVKKYLLKVLLPAEIIPRGHKELITEDGLKHVLYNEKGKKSFLTYHIASQEILSKYNHAKRTFQETKTKRYGMFDKELENEDTLEALNKLGFDYGNENIRNSFNFANAHTKAVSYLCQVHIKCCPLCRKHGLSDDSISRVLKRANGEIQKQKKSTEKIK
jgi:hypothetical protein